jgi:hypothetical protein
VISSVFHRRRSERLSQLIDEASGGRRHHVRSGVDDNLADLLAVSRRLADLPVKVEAHPEFRDGLKAMLLATIEREGIGATATVPEPEAESAVRRRIPVVGGALRRPGGIRPPMARRTKARGAIVIGLAAGTLALSGMSAASGDAIPGDPLYSVKRSTEKAQLALAGSDTSRGQLYLEFARTRLDEAGSVKSNASGLGRVLDDMDSETQQGVKLLTTTAMQHKDASALDAVDAFVTSQRAGAEKLRTEAAADGRSRADKSVRLLEAIQQRSKALRLVLACGMAATAQADAIGPRSTGSCKTPGNRQDGSNGQNGPTGNTNRKTDGENSAGAPENSQAPVPPPTSTATVPNEIGTPTNPPNTKPSKDGGLLGGLHGIVGG